MRGILRAPWKGWLYLTMLYNRVKFALWGVHFDGGARLEGKVYCRNEGEIHLGRGVHVTGGYCRNRISRNLGSSLCADRGATLTIGEGSGISSSCIWARSSIRIGRRVNIGANCIILDHDAHSLDPERRLSYSDDYASTATSPVEIGDDVLVGTSCIILKGVSIGRGSVLGAGSVLTRSIPEGELWAGNPASFIRALSTHPADE